MRTDVVCSEWTKVRTAATLTVPCEFCCARGVFVLGKPNNWSERLSQHSCYILVRYSLRIHIAVLWLVTPSRLVCV